MNVVVDTHALLWLLNNDKRLSLKARNSINKASKVFIPSIVLLELLYLLEKKGKRDLFARILRAIRNDNQYVVIALDSAVVEEISKHKLSIEIHDRIIIATASLLRIPIVTKDKTIQQVYRKTIW